MTEISKICKGRKECSLSEDMDMMIEDGKRSVFILGYWKALPYLQKGLILITVLKGYDCSR